MDQVGVDFVLVAGQAVNFWASYFSKQEPDLELFKPFVSKDIDLFGSAEGFREMKKVIKGELKMSADVRTPVIGVFTTDSEPVLIFELLRSVYGPVLTDKIKQRAKRVGGISVIDPLSLLISKCHNAGGISQENRQDIRHVKMMVLAAHAHYFAICDAVGNQITPRQFINECKYLLEFTGNAVFQKGLALAGASLPECFPLEKIATLGEKHPAIGRFYANRLWPALREVGPSGPVEGL